MKNQILVATTIVMMGAACLLPSTQAQETKAEHSPDTVPKGEFPAAGHSYNVDFGDYKFRLDFKSEQELTYTSLADPKVTETVNITVTKLRPDLFMVAWTEKAGNTVVHIEDFENKVFYTNITSKGGTFTRLKGPVTSVK